MNEIRERLRRAPGALELPRWTGPDIPACASGLRDLYADGFNGGYFWNGALLVRPLDDRIESVSSVAAWNGPALWIHEYGEAALGATFFAEDALGVQYALRDGKLAQFDPETAAFEELADSVDGLFARIGDDAAYYTGAPLLAAWEAKNGPLESGFRLVPRQLFCLGGEFSEGNLIAKRDVEGMRARAQLFQRIKALPDGTTIRISITD